MKQAFEFLFEKDSIFKGIFERYGMPVIPKRPQGFETLVLLILEQQVSIDSAKATFLKMKARIVDFKPEAVVVVPDEDFRSLGVSRQKTAYIKGLANAVITNEIDIESLASKSPETVREELIKLKGIGNWTVDVYLMMVLQRSDLFPLGDVALMTSVRETKNLPKDFLRDAIETIAAAWKPYRTIAAFILWHSYLRKRSRSG